MQVFPWAGAGAALAPGVYTTTVAQFDALNQTPDAGAAVGYTFLTTAAPIRPNVGGMGPPQLRVSESGGRAVEHADLPRRQPRFFFADPYLVPDWNAALTRAGSLFQLVPEAGAT